jgi:hypothetical protein
LLFERWDDDKDRENILRVALAVETEPTVIGVSLHFLAITRNDERAGIGLTGRP